MIILIMIIIINDFKPILYRQSLVIFQKSVNAKIRMSKLTAKILYSLIMHISCTEDSKR